MLGASVEHQERQGPMTTACCVPWMKYLSLETLQLLLMTSEAQEMMSPADSVVACRRWMVQPTPETSPVAAPASGRKDIMTLFCKIVFFNMDVMGT